MSRPEVSVVMPFAGDAAAARAALDALRSLRIAPGDELILVDNAGTVAPGDGVTVIPERRRALARARAQRRRRARQGRMDPVHRLRHTAKSRPARRVLCAAARQRCRRTGRRRAPGTRRRHAGRALRQCSLVPRPADAPPAPVHASCRRGQPDGQASGVRRGGGLLRGSSAPPRTPTSPGAFSGPDGGSSRVARRGSSISTGRASPSSVTSGAATPPAERGWRAATKALSPSPQRSGH